MACSLQPSEWSERKKLIGDIAAAGVNSVEVEGEVLAFEFDFSPELRGLLEKLIELEGACCPFLRFGLDENSSLLILTVEAPDGPETALDAIRHMFASPAVNKA
jgi:hypothetical protein